MDQEQLRSDTINIISNPVDAVATDVGVIPVLLGQSYNTVPVPFAGATVPDQVVPTNDVSHALPANLDVVTTYPVSKEYKIVYFKN